MEQMKCFCLKKKKGGGTGITEQLTMWIQFMKDCFQEFCDNWYITRQSSNDIYHSICPAGENKRPLKMKSDGQFHRDRHKMRWNNVSKSEWSLSLTRTSTATCLWPRAPSFKCGKKTINWQKDSKTVLELKLLKGREQFCLTKIFPICVN